ncbi:MAG: hypothetical protein LC541_06360 [Candidatus Thiodiazotropha sp.]|nr:hypothetical protein [Candidatus Thiodiazotropha sp.]MCM8882940.1 hypothetical protein [Candidatus Thiodiazotropha sp.]MCM8921202.1 hypothetical protein [Candidatus Thiodiazotropha sp.]
MRVILTTLLAAGLLAGCTSPKFNKELVCEVEGDWGQALKFITYKTYTFPDMGRFGGGKHLTAGVYFDGGLFFWRSKWLMDDFVFGPLGFEQQVAKQGCTQSTISDNVVVWLPYASQGGPNMSQIVVSEGPWSGFHRYVIPSREGPPYLSDGEGNLLTLLNWRPADASLKKGILRIRQETPSAKMFIDSNGKFLARKHVIYSGWQDRPCEGCDPILWRTVESTDLGLTWKVADWGIIDEARLPPEAELPLKGSEYYYDVEIEKILPLPPDTPLSLGYKHRYLDFFSKNNRSITTAKCPEKGQPVSREKGTLICTDSRSIDRYFVGREGYKPEWTALDFSKDHIKRLKRKMGLDAN